MSNAVSYKAEGYHSVTPYMIVDGADEAIAFYTRAFDAVETMRLPGPNGKIMHAEIRIGDSHVMLSDANPAMGMQGPEKDASSPLFLHLYVEDVDAVIEQAVAAGATLSKPARDEFYGDRQGIVRDPFGHAWSIATHTEDLSPDEIQSRFEAMMKGG